MRKILILIFSFVLLASFATADLEVHLRGGSHTDTDGAYETIMGIEGWNSESTLVGGYMHRDTDWGLASGASEAYRYYNITGAVIGPYNIQSIDYSWTTLNNPTTLNLGDDDYAFVNLGFDVNFFGTNYNQIYVSSNGFIGFSDLFNPPSNGCCEGQDLPNSNNPNNLFVGWWEDLQPASGGGTGTIKYQTFSSFNNPYKTVIQFDNVGHYNDLNNKVSFQIVLNKDY